MRGVETLRVRGYGHDRLGPMAETCGSTVGFAPVGAGPRFSGSACERDRARRGIYSRRRAWGSEGTPETIGSCGSPVEAWGRSRRAGGLKEELRVGGEAAFGAVPREHTCVASRERERAQGELQGSSDFQVGVDLRVTWAAEQRKRTKF